MSKKSVFQTTKLALLIGLEPVVMRLFINVTDLVFLNITTMTTTTTQQLNTQ